MPRKTKDEWKLEALEARVEILKLQTKVSQLQESVGVLNQVLNGMQKRESDSISDYAKKELEEFKIKISK